METLQFFGDSCILGEKLMPVTPDNDNLRLIPDWRTPAEFFQWIRREKQRLRRLLAADFRLRSCPEWRRDWEVTLAMEKCGLYHLCGQR
jgi:hypothetical protein